MALYNSFQVVLPVYNEQDRIAASLSHLGTYCSSITVIDNYSTDASLAIVHSQFPSVEVVRIKNNGTTESPHWWAAASEHFSSDYILFASCSEFVPATLMHLFDQVSREGIVDIVETPRLSITGDDSTDYLYCRPASLFSSSIKLPSVARFVRWQAIDKANIFPHDAFASQSTCTRFQLVSTYRGHFIHHFRIPPSRLTLQKHLRYSQVYATCKCRSNFFYALADSSARTILDSARIVRALVDRQANRTLIAEYCLRLLMHVQVVWFSLFPRRHEG